MSVFFPSPLSSQAETSAASRHAGLLRHFVEVRAHSLALAAPLSAEDQCVQSMPDASPTKWHLAHTSWFFEVFVLQPLVPGYVAFDARFFYLFNSYYEAMGSRHPRSQRGLLTRPSLAEVHAYRQHVDAAMGDLLNTCSEADWETLAPLVTLGLHHEQQHQELLLTDILHTLWCNPLLPAYQAANHAPSTAPAEPVRWVTVTGGTTQVGHAGGGFAFDNEAPRHTVLLSPCQVAHRLVTCGEYAQFIADGGYLRAELWLADGWAAVQAGGWQAPLYWLQADDPRLLESSGVATPGWQVFGLSGVQPLQPSAPVSQLSFYEAAAFAEWATTQPDTAGARLPTEFEWEVAASLPGMAQTTGAVWQWTRSSYDPYPGFRPNPGAVGEYNGKFMVSQLVLRGGSQATPAGHTRTSYRNFFPPAARWQFSGLRLAKDAAW